MWTDITREQHGRKGLWLPSDLTDEEWALFEPLGVAQAVGGDALSSARRPTLAHAPARTVSTGIDSATLVLPLARQWTVAVDQPRAGDGGP